MIYIMTVFIALMKHIYYLWYKSLQLLSEHNRRQ